MQLPVERGGGLHTAAGRGYSWPPTGSARAAAGGAGDGGVTHSCRERIQLATDGISSCSCRWSGGGGGYTQLPGEDTAGHRRNQLVQLPVERGGGGVQTAAGRGHSWPPTESARAAAGGAGEGGGYRQLPGEDTAGHRRDQLVQLPVEGEGGRGLTRARDTMMMIVFLGRHSY